MHPGGLWIYFNNGQDITLGWKIVSASGDRHLNLTSEEAAEALANASEGCCQSIQNLNVKGFFGHSLRASLEALIAMFPFMMNPSIAELIERYRNRALDWKISGAGGGGYLILISEELIENGIRISTLLGLG